MPNFVKDFNKQKRQRAKLKLYGGQVQCRTFFFVRDVTRGVLAKILRQNKVKF